MPFKNPHPLYGTWMSMKGRCSNPNNRQWNDYGGRGIAVCDRWRNNFQAFISDMPPRPDGHSLDRIDNDGDYSPENCRWATRKEQQRNQRRALYVLIEGKKYRAIDLAEKSGMKTDTIVIRAAAGLSYAEVINPERRVFKKGLALGGKASGKKKRSRTHCIRGHKFTPANTFYRAFDNTRACRKCRTKAGKLDPIIARS